MARTRMNILFCCDENYVQHVTVCMTSLAINNSASDLNIACVVRELTPASRRKIEESLARFPNVTLRLEEPKPIDESAFPVRVHYTVDTYRRFWIRDYFPNEEKALYLDPDMVVHDDLRALWDTDLTGSVFAAVPIPGSDRPGWFRMPEGTLYCNTGTILFNLPEWDKSGCPQALIEFTARHGHFLRDADQDSFNLLLAGRWKPLEGRYNMMPFRFRDPKTPPEFVSSPAVIHFSGGNKPWKYGSNTPAKALYWHYLKETPFRDYVEPDRTLPNIVRHTLSRLIPPRLKDLLRGSGAPSTAHLPPRPEAQLR